MTVSYQYEVASSTSGGFTRLLFMWRGSLYKLIYRELVMFLIIFGMISAIYRHVLTNEQKRSFEVIVVYCDTFINLIPLSFVLGFYVAYVAGRWWQQYMAIPWPDKVMHSVALYIIGNDEYGRMVRRALMRYLNLSLILVLRSISSAVKRRFPTLDHVVDAGFMTALELDLFVSVPSLEFNTYWIPCTWFINLLKEARTNHRLPDSQGLKIIMEEFNDFRAKCGLLWSYDWVSIPLVYTQVVTLATYSFFAVALIGRQYIDGDTKPFQMKFDVYFPVFTILQFFFFMGLLKVAEQLINPFGDDDEDFELNWIIDRHTKVSYLGVDTLMNRCPPLVKDIYYDSENIVLPYTEAAAAYKRQTYRGSVANMPVPEEKQTMFLPNILEEDESASVGGSGTPRTSSANLAAHNETPPATSSKRQGGSTPQPSRKFARGTSETIVTLDLREDVEEQQSPASTNLTKTNGRSTSRLTEAVKMFSSRTKLTDSLMSRKPFFSLAKSSKVSIQPWPSATNLKSDRVEGSDSYWNAESSKRELKETRSFNIPSIDVRQSSIDDEIDDEDDESTDRDTEIAAKKRSQVMYETRSRSSTRSFMQREPSIEESNEPRCDCEHASSSNAAGYCNNDFCPIRQHDDQRQHFQRSSVQRIPKRRPRHKAMRFNSFPKFLAKRQRSMFSQRAWRTSTRIESLDDGLTITRSSPELRMTAEFASSSAAGTSSDHHHHRHHHRPKARFFTGGDDDDDVVEIEETSGDVGTAKKS